MKLASVVIVTVLVATGAFAATTSPAKEWATDLPAYLSTHPGRWVVGRSTEPALSADEATPRVHLYKAQ